MTSINLIEIINKKLNFFSNKKFLRPLRSVPNAIFSTWTSFIWTVLLYRRLSYSRIKATAQITAKRFKLP